MPSVVDVIQRNSIGSLVETQMLMSPISTLPFSWKTTNAWHKLERFVSACDSYLKEIHSLGTVGVPKWADADRRAEE